MEGHRERESDRETPVREHNYRERGEAGRRGQTAPTLINAGLDPFHRVKGTREASASLLLNFRDPILRKRCRILYGCGVPGVDVARFLSSSPSLTQPGERRQQEQIEWRRSESNRQEENKNNDNKRKHQLEPQNIISLAEQHRMTARFKFQDGVSMKQGCTFLTFLFNSLVSVLSALVHS